MAKSTASPTKKVVIVLLVLVACFFVRRFAISREEKAPESVPTEPKSVLTAADESLKKAMDDIKEKEAELAKVKKEAAEATARAEKAVREKELAERKPNPFSSLMEGLLGASKRGEPKESASSDTWEEPTMPAEEGESKIKIIQGRILHLQQDYEILAKASMTDRRMVKKHGADTILGMLNQSSLEKKQDEMKEIKAQIEALKKDLKKLRKK